MSKPLTCCLCGLDITHDLLPDGEYLGNNPDPFQHIKGGRCCDWCNNLKVTPARLGLTGDEAERMGRTFIQVQAVQQHLWQERNPSQEVEEE